MDIGWKWQKRGILLGKLLEKPGCTWKWLQPMVAQPWRLALRLAWPRRGVRQKKGGAGYETPAQSTSMFADPS
jgi:hypothetical protein